MRWLTMSPMEFAWLAHVEADATTVFDRLCVQGSWLRNDVTQKAGAVLLGQRGDAKSPQWQVVGATLGRAMRATDATMLRVTYPDGRWTIVTIPLPLQAALVQVAIGDQDFAVRMTSDGALTSAMATELAALGDPQGLLLLMCRDQGPVEAVAWGEDRTPERVQGEEPLPRDAVMEACALALSATVG